jgi:hypothetical protein
MFRLYLRYVTRRIDKYFVSVARLRFRFAYDSELVPLNVPVRRMLR